MAIFHHMPYDEYAALDGWRWSHIKILDNKSPLHLQHAVKNPDDGDTASRGQARAIHTLIFEPELFEKEYSVYAKRRNKKDTEYKDHLRGHPDTTVLNPREEAEARKTADAILANPVIAPYLATGNGEVVVTWIDKATGLLCKARVDFISGHLFPFLDPAVYHGTMIDLKNIGTTNERLAMSIIAKNGWNGQAAHYKSGLAANGLNVGSGIIAAEIKEPNDTALFHLHEERALKAGEEQRSRLMERLAKCVKEDRWPGRHEDIYEIDAPSWAYGDDDDFNLDEV